MIADVNSLPVHYEERGIGTPILMLHGQPVDHRQMLADMEPLFVERMGWRRIYPDLPGMGRTPGADWVTHQDQMLDVVTGFLDRVAPGATVRGRGRLVRRLPRARSGSCVGIDARWARPERGGGGHGP